MSNEKEIGLVASRHNVRPDGTGSISIKMLRSTCVPLGCNELPVILNTLKRTHLLDAGATNIGFDYTFSEQVAGDGGGFPLGQGVGFPYVFDVPTGDPDVYGIILG